MVELPEVVELLEQLELLAPSLGLEVSEPSLGALGSLPPIGLELRELELPDELAESSEPVPSRAPARSMSLRHSGSRARALLGGAAVTAGRALLPRPLRTVDVAR